MASSFNLLNSIQTLPKASVAQDAEHLIEQMQSDATNMDELLAEQRFIDVIHAMAGNSSYLARLLWLQHKNLPDIFSSDISQSYDVLMDELASLSLAGMSQSEVMQQLRLAKQRMALIIAIADIGGIWPVMEVTKRLSFFAERAVNISLDYLLLDAHKRSELKLKNKKTPQIESGIAILAMGKLGAYELNYSSDIDLIILFDAETAPYSGSRNVQQLYTRIAQDLVQIMEGRTADGYVFRTDLRLRPDPRSMPLAVNVHAAIAYYESLGQNWERAAMIKARQIAGDEVLGDLFAQHMTPYIWRKALDFESIADIQSIKRQMTIKVGEDIAVGGHNIKLGRGGIREIEFYVQTQQLLWGGRYPELQIRPTLDVLQALVVAGLLSEKDAETLTVAYKFLRRVEHYIQMTDDQQNHTLPEQQDELAHLSIFLGYDDIDSFKTELRKICISVHEIYSESMEDTEPLSIDGNLVFTGVEHDPETLKTLERMGYKNPQALSDIIQNWHRGSRRATKSKRARQILTELIPTLLTSLSNTANPDSAFFRFDDFIAKLPSGVQIFSLLNAKPELLDVIARILGSAPALGRQLAKYPHLLDTVLHANFYAKLPNKEALLEEVLGILLPIENYEMTLAELRIFKNEKHFQAGLHMLKGNATSLEIGAYLSDIAEVVTEQVLRLVKEEFMQSYGEIKGGALSIVALGKFGSRELTFGSDLDLVFIYDEDSKHKESDGEKPLDARSYYNRLCARIVTAFTMRDREGLLYEVDTRLRPSGGDSPIATPFTAFDKYFTQDAWVFEYMALTKARVITSQRNESAKKLSDHIKNYLSRDYDEASLKHDVNNMRLKIAQSFHTDNPWHIKHVRGGLVDLDFIAQYLVLRYGKSVPKIIKPHTYNILLAAKEEKLLGADIADTLLKAQRLQAGLLSFLRLCSDGEIDEATAPIGLKNLLVERFERTSFKQLRADLLEAQDFVYKQFNEILC